MNQPTTPVKNATLGDLITVPPVETVVRLAEADPAATERSRRLLTTFVVTAEVEQILTSLLTRVAKQQGAGTFIKGNYGSGKSHLLAVLSLLLADGSYWEQLTHPLGRRFRTLADRKHLVVRIALHHYTAETALETIFWEATEAALHEQLEQTVFLRRVTVLLKHFNRYILPRHEEFLEEQECSRSVWEQRCREQPEQAAEQVQTFIQRHGIPLQPRFDRRTAIQTLTAVLDRAQYHGVLFAVDELSEFLKAKPQASALAEDLRFLQFMGEQSTRSPIYLVAALQEWIEQTGYPEAKLVRRIKDRFPLRFTLSARHVNQLIAKRLIQKHPGAEQVIRTIYRRHRLLFPQADVEEKTFVDLYPVHPVTVRFLEGLSPLFSQHRGVVDFIYRQLTGDENRHWPGMLAEPHERLLTPDTIFDHFRERIRERPELTPFVDVVFATLAREIPTLFPEERDRRIALKAVKILILVEISPLEQRHTAQRLAPIINEPVADLDAELNTQYLTEVILDRLVREGSFMNRRTLDNGDPVYYISLEQTVHQIVRNRVQELMKQPPDLPAEFQTLLPYLKDSLLPLAYFATGQRRKVTLTWQNTQREGWVYFVSRLPMNPVTLDAIRQELQTTEKDFVLVIGGVIAETAEGQPPFGLNHLEGRFAKAVIGWMPRPLTTEEQEFLHRFHAYDRLARQLASDTTPQERPVYAALREWLSKHHREYLSLVEEWYFDGRLADRDGWLDFRFTLVYPDFKQLLQQLFSPVLQRLYPRHSEIMPGDVPQQFVVEKLYTGLLQPGRLKSATARARYLDGLVKAYLEPLSLVQDEGQDFVVTTRFPAGSLGEQVLNACSGSEPVDLYLLYWQFRKSEWGLTRIPFHLLVAALLATGRLSAFRAGNVVLFQTPAQLTDGSVDAVGRGKLIDGELQAALEPFLELETFVGITLPFTQAVQELVWRRMKNFRDELSRLQEHHRLLTERYHAYPAFSVVVGSANPDLELLDRFAATLRVSYTAHAGLEHLGETLGVETLRRIPAEYQRLSSLVRFIENRFVELNQAYVYLHHPLLNRVLETVEEPLRDAYRHLYRELEEADFLAADRIADFSGRFYRFKERYSRWYRTAHDAYYGEPFFRAAARLPSEPPLRLLRRFHRLNAVTARPDWVTIQEELANLPSACKRDVERQLAAAPLCACNYRPGQQPVEKSLTTIRQQAEQGVQSVLHQLRTTYRWALDEYRTGLLEVGDRKTADGLERLLSASREGTLPWEQLLEGTTGAVIEAINAALSGKILILRRSLEELIQQFSRRQVTVREARALFEAWLTGGGEVTEETQIRIYSERDLPTFDPRAYRSAEAVIREEGVRFFEAFWLATWALQHERRKWLERIRDRYRVGTENLDTVAQLSREPDVEVDLPKVNDYLQQRQLLPWLEQMVRPEDLNGEELATFLLREEIVEPLSRAATRRFLRQVAPTEPLTKEQQDWHRRLLSHRRRELWPHLTFLHQFFETITIVSRGEQESNMPAFYLREGWRLDGLVDGLQQANRSQQLLAEDRLRQLTDRVGRLQASLVVGKQPVARRELPLPYWSLNRFPKRLAQRLNRPPLAVFIVDAMRWDVWEFLRPWFTRHLPGRRMTYLAAVEVAEPTTTETNRPLLIQQLADAVGALEWHLESVAEDPARESSIREHLHSGRDLILLNTTIVDSLLHEQPARIDPLLTTIRERMETFLAPVFAALPPELPVVITADHGFTTKNGDYVHGGNSCQEKIVPFALWEPDGNPER
jgi:hypothetical protein